MSTVNVMPAASTRDAISYALVGRGSQRAQHESDGTTRASALSSSMGSADDFVERAEHLAHVHRRTNQLYTYTQNFSPDEFDVNDPRDVQRVNELGVKLAKRLSASDYMVVTHTDSAGGHLHNHIYVINHDNLTGKALKRGTSWRHGLHQINDALMRDEGCEVLPSPEEAKPDWDVRRSQFAIGGFEQTLGDHVADALRDARSTDREAFEQVLSERGVRLRVTDRDGWTYSMRRADNGKWGRKKSSTLTPEFTAEGVQEIFNYHSQNRQKGKDHGNSRGTQGASGKRVDYGVIRSVGDDAARRRAAALRVDHGSERADQSAHGHGGADLAAVRESIERAARESAHDEAVRDRENAEARRRAARSQSSSEIKRWLDSHPLGSRRTSDDEASRRGDQESDFEFG